MYVCMIIMKNLNSFIFSIFFVVEKIEKFSFHVILFAFTFDISTVVRIRTSVKNLSGVRNGSHLNKIIHI